MCKCAQTEHKLCAITIHSTLAQPKLSHSVLCFTLCFCKLHCTAKLHLQLSHKREFCISLSCQFLLTQAFTCQSQFTLCCATSQLTQTKSQYERKINQQFTKSAQKLKTPEQRQKTGCNCSKDCGCELSNCFCWQMQL